MATWWSGAGLQDWPYHGVLPLAVGRRHARVLGAATYQSNFQARGLELIIYAVKKCATAPSAWRDTAVNRDGFEVDVTRRKQSGDDPNLIKLSDEDEDFFRPRPTAPTCC